MFRSLTLAFLLAIIPAIALSQPSTPPTPEETIAMAQIQIGQLQQAVGQLTLENLSLKKKLADLQPKPTTK